MLDVRLATKHNNTGLERERRREPETKGNKERMSEREKTQERKLCIHRMQNSVDSDRRTEKDREQRERERKRERERERER